MGTNSLTIIGVVNEIPAIGTHVDQYGIGLGGDIPCRNDISPYTPTRANSISTDNGTVGTSLYPFKNVHLEPDGKVFFGTSELDNAAPIVNSKAGFTRTNTFNFQVEELTTGAEANKVHVFEGTNKFYGSDAGLYTGLSGSTTVVSLAAADGSNPRWDLISLDASAGSYTATTGAASSTPFFPSIPAGEDALGYVYRPTSVNTIFTRNVFDARQALTTKSVDGHFKTNFSIDQKEDTEATEFETQQMFQSIPFETKFEVVQPDKTFLHNLATVLVPSFSHEVTETGSWSDNNSGVYKFGGSRFSTTSGDTAKIAFTGVACGIAYESFTNRGTIYVELSEDGGSTWTNRKDISIDSGSNQPNTPIDCYTGLEYGDYQLRVTVGDHAASGLYLSYFFYTTHMNQRPVSQYSLTSGSATDLDDVPPTTCLLTGTWVAINQNSSNYWNSTRTYSTNTDADMQVRVYGSAIWVNVQWTSTSDVDVAVTIDGSSSKALAASINVDTANNDVPAWVRLDDGTLDEGWHDVKLDITTVTSGNFFINGWGYYSANAPTTVARSLICGEESYIEGIDSSNFSVTGAGWGAAADGSTSLLRRNRATSTDTDYLTITTPNNTKLKAIYFSHTINSDKGEVILNLGGSGVLNRYVNSDTNNYAFNNVIFLAYDKLHDGDLHNKEFRITKNGGSDMIIDGVVFEIGDEVSSEKIHCMPKWSRYCGTETGNTNSIVSNSYRLDVYGSKSDGKAGRKPFLHSGWLFISLNATRYWRAAILYSAIEDMWHQYNSTTIPQTYHASTRAKDYEGAGYLASTEPGLIDKRTGTDAFQYYMKIFCLLNKVV